MIRISDPSKSMERVYARIYETEQAMAAAERDGLHGLLPSYRRRLAALKGAATRLAKQMGA